MSTIYDSFDSEGDYHMDHDPNGLIILKHRRPAIDYTIPIDVKRDIKTGQRTIRFFTHPLATEGQTWDTEAAATLAYRELLTQQAAREKAEKAQREREASWDRLRLETTKLADIPRLWRELLREYTGIDSTLVLIELRFDQNASRWNGVATGTWSGGFSSVLDLVYPDGKGILGFKFRGLHRTVVPAKAGANFMVPIEFYLRDFPGLQDLYTKRCDYARRMEEYAAQVGAAQAQAVDRASRREDVCSLTAAKERHQFLSHELRARVKQHQDRAAECLKRTDEITAEEIQSSRPVFMHPYTEEQAREFATFSGSSFVASEPVKPDHDPRPF